MMFLSLRNVLPLISRWQTVGHPCCTYTNTWTGPLPVLGVKAASERWKEAGGGSEREVGGRGPKVREEARRGEGQACLRGKQERRANSQPWERGLWVVPSWKQEWSSAVLLAMGATLLPSFLKEALFNEAKRGLSLWLLP